MNTYDGKNIKVLEGLEPVRTRPGMYTNGVSWRGINHLVYEIVDNSVDEASSGYCDTIRVILNEDGSCTVSDNGRGIPVDIHPTKKIPTERVILTTLHAGGKFDNTSYKNSSGLHGVGSSVVNALSEFLKIEVKRNKKIWYDSYHRGIPDTEIKENELLDFKNIEDESTGTTITFKPDLQIFPDITFHEKEIKERLHHTAYLNPSLTLYYEDRRNPKAIEKITYHEPDGIDNYMKELNKDKEVLNKVIKLKDSFDGDKGKIEVEIAIQYTNTFEEHLYGFCNNLYTEEGGTQITGFKSSLTSIINQYAKKTGVLKEKDENFTGDDARNGITAIIVVKHPDPVFEGQTKTKLDNQDAAKAVSYTLTNNLPLALDKDPDGLKKILNQALKSVKIRKAEEKSKKVLLEPSGKKKFSFDSNGKLADCLSKDPSERELFICEGESAAGSAKDGRNKQTQAILPIRGKILNCQKAQMNRVLANAEIKTLIYALGCGFLEGYGDDFDISKLRYDKICIMTDADTDGNHIASLLITLFYNLFPEIILDGHLYRTTPPLYGVTAKNGLEYLYDDKALEKYRKSHPGKLKLQRFKGLGEMNAEELYESTMNPATRTLKRITMKDVKEADSIIDTLMGLDVEPRKKYIVDHAIDAKLDL